MGQAMKPRPGELMCRVKAYPSEEAAARAIWAMKQNRLKFADNLKPQECKLCSVGRKKVWHTVPIKPWDHRTGLPPAWGPR